MKALVLNRRADVRDRLVIDGCGSLSITSAEAAEGYTHATVSRAWEIGPEYGSRGMFVRDYRRGRTVITLEGDEE
jgi:hypothetical protein